MKKVSTSLVMILLVLAGFFGYAMIASARPDAPPHSVLMALQGIQEALMALNEPVLEPQAAEPNAVVVEGYCDYLETAEDSNQVVFTVPLGKQFVLRKLYVVHRINYITGRWKLTADDIVLVSGSIVHSSNGKGVHDFPDNCIVVNAGETLRVVNTLDAEMDILKTTIIGYFRDVQ